ncbi:MAG: hypothetical protein PHW69_05460 [Elusimicrobiaceae bacterium]|nr:hypothetical protein [Elusimicrobiaceae bacterium]
MTNRRMATAVAVTMLAALAQVSFAQNNSGTSAMKTLSATPAVTVPVTQAQPQETTQIDLSVINTGIKSAYYTFNTKYQVVSKSGRLYMRAFGENGWAPVPNQPGKATEISADGDNLIALGPDRSVHYMKFSSFKWIRKWGKPFSATLVIPDCRSWAIAHKGPEVGGYEDPAGNFKAISVGVTTLYMLTKDGQHLKYADPWLPADFKHRISMPMRGRFIAERMSVSASTIFLIGKSGRMFTRLADFDTTGADPALAYSFTEPGQKTIILPPEDWREQPAIQGRITSNITIINNGRGNAGRELRVEGVDEAGNGGYYAKQIFGGSWTFVKTGAQVKGPFLGGAPEYGPEVEADYPVIYKSLLHRYLPETSVIRFSQDTDLAEIKTTVGGKEIKLPLYIREAFLTRKSGTHKLFGTIVTPDEVLKSSDPETAAFAKDFLRGRKLLDVHVFFNGRTVKLKNAPWRAFRESIAVKQAAREAKAAAKKTGRNDKD